MCIKDWESFVKLNTFLLSPYSLSKYLIGHEMKLKEFNNEILSYINFIISLRDVKNERELFKILSNNETWLDYLTRITIASYESIGRLFLFLDREYKKNNINDDELVILIKKCIGRSKGLPIKSTDIKEKLSKNKNCVRLLAYIISKAYFSNLSKYLKHIIVERNLNNPTPYIIEEIKIRYEELFKGFDLLLNLVNDENKIYIEYLAKFISHLYNILSKGESKAYEGYGYEQILQQILEKNGISAERIKKKEDEEGHIEDLCRNWDIYIPSKTNPNIVIEVMYNVTTSSTQTNKVKAIIECIRKLRRLGVSIYVLMDGAGWLARKSDASKLINNKDIEVFTFHKECIDKLINSLIDLENF